MARKTSKGKAKKAVVRMVTMVEPSAANNVNVGEMSEGVGVGWRVKSKSNLPKLPPVGTRWRSDHSGSYWRVKNGKIWFWHNVRQSWSVASQQNVAWLDEYRGPRILPTTPLPDTAASRRKAVAAALAGSLYSTRKVVAIEPRRGSRVHACVCYTIPAATYREFLAGGGS